MLKSLALLPVAVLCLVTLTPNQGLAQSSSAKPVGTWERQTKDGHFLLTIKEDRLHIRFEKSDEAMTTVDADYSVSRDGILFGVVIFAEKDAGSEEDREVKSDLPFCCRYRVDGDELTIRDGKITDGDLDKLAGRYHRVEEKVSSTKMPSTTMCEQKAGCCLGYGLRIVVPTLDAKPTCEQKTGCCPAATFTTGAGQDFRLETCPAAPPMTVKTGACRGVSTKFAAHGHRGFCFAAPSHPLTTCSIGSGRYRGSPRLWSRRRLAFPYLYEKNRDDVQIVTECTSPTRSMTRPLLSGTVGPARLHHCHYKYTVVLQRDDLRRVSRSPFWSSIPVSRSCTSTGIISTLSRPPSSSAGPGASCP